LISATFLASSSMESFDFTYIGIQQPAEPPGQLEARNL